MLYYLVFKGADSKEHPVVKYLFSSDDSKKVWETLVSKVDEYFEEEMINFYIDLVDSECTKESSDDLTLKELKKLKKVDPEEFKNYMEGSDEESSPDCYYLLEEDSRELNMLSKMKLIKKDKNMEPIQL